MIDTKMKTMIAGLGLVAVLGGCGAKEETEIVQSPRSGVVYRIKEVTVPIVCDTVTGFTLTKGEYSVIECIDK